jgi:hypothetical protein
VWKGGGGVEQPGGQRCAALVLRPTSSTHLGGHDGILCKEFKLVAHFDHEQHARVGSFQVEDLLLLPGRTANTVCSRHHGMVSAEGLRAQSGSISTRGHALNTVS